MEGRNGARPLTQRTFDEEETPSPEEDPPAPTDVSIPPEPLPSEPVSREPSDVGLRARQLKWVQERERAIGRSRSQDPGSPQ